MTERGRGEIGKELRSLADDVRERALAIDNTYTAAPLHHLAAAMIECADISDSWDGLPVENGEYLRHRAYSLRDGISLRPQPGPTVEGFG